MLKAMAKEPGERYATAGHLAEDLRRFVAGQPILARPSGWIERSMALEPAQPGGGRAVGAVAAALVAVAVISVLYADRQYHGDRARHQEITRLNVDLGKERERLTTSLTESNRLLAIRNFDRGQAAFEKDQIGPGLLWMIESWRSAVEAGDPAWQHAARANLAAWQPHHARLKAVLSHDGPVDAAAFSPDGKTILTGGDDSTARLWDAATGQPIGHALRHRRRGHERGVQPRRQDRPHRLRRQDGAALGRRHRPTRRIALAHEGDVRAVAFSPDGRTILTGGNDRTARLWDAATLAAHRSARRASGYGDGGGVQPRRQDHPHREQRRRGAALGRATRVSPSASRSCIKDRSKPWSFSPDGKWS